MTTLHRLCNGPATMAVLMLIFLASLNLVTGLQPCAGLNPYMRGLGPCHSDSHTLRVMDLTSIDDIGLPVRRSLAQGETAGGVITSIITLLIIIAIIWCCCTGRCGSYQPVTVVNQTQDTKQEVSHSVQTGPVNVPVTLHFAAPQDMYQAAVQQHATNGVPSTQNVGVPVGVPAGSLPQQSGIEMVTSSTAVHSNAYTVAASGPGHPVVPGPAPVPSPDKAQFYPPQSGAPQGQYYPQGPPPNSQYPPQGPPPTSQIPPHQQAQYGQMQAKVPDQLLHSREFYNPSSIRMHVRVL